MKPKIVILSAFFRPFRSGAEACVEEIPTRLKGQYDFTIVTARLRKDLPKRDEYQGIPIIRLGFGFTFDKWLFPFLAPIVVLRLRPKIVHAVLETFAGLAMVFCRAPKKILTCQSTNRSFLIGWMHSAADRVTVISTTLQKRAQTFGRDAVLIPNGLTLNDIPSAEKIPGRILFAGRLEPMKGIDTLLKSFANVQSSHAQLRIVGDGSQRHSLESLTRELGISDRVTFVGFVPVPDVYKEFAEAEIFCGLSRSEAFGNVFIEAQAAKCAVLGTRVGGIPDTVRDSETGLLVEPDDVDAATEALHKLLSDEGLRHHLTTAGTANAEQYDWGRLVERYGEVYKELL